STSHVGPTIPRHHARSSNKRNTIVSQYAITSPTSPSSPCRIGRSRSRRTTTPQGRAGPRLAGASVTRNRGGSSTMHRPTNSPRIFEPTGSLDRERFLRQPFRRGDELRNPLFRVGQD